MTVDLRSDTLTQPTPEMYIAMMQAVVGDDVFGEDPTVLALENKAAAMFGKEAALFCPSGTMCNQIAIKLHTNPLDEVICDKRSHIHLYETGGYAFHSGVALKLIDGDDGRIHPHQITENIQPDHDWLPRTSLVVVENTCNKGGGSFYDFEWMKKLSQASRENGLKIHLDGARIFNALVEINKSPMEVGPLFDTISICLSKGLGAPVGSVLVGSAAQIKQARRFRKVMGGGMRQAGFLAAAGIYALDHHIDRLKEDHLRASEMASTLDGLSFIREILPVATNIVIFEVELDYPAADFVSDLEKKGVKSIAFGQQWVRMVTHLGITDRSLKHAQKSLQKLK